MKEESGGSIGKVKLGYHLQFYESESKSFRSYCASRIHPLCCDFGLHNTWKSIKKDARGEQGAKRHAAKSSEVRRALFACVDFRPALLIPFRKFVFVSRFPRSLTFTRLFSPRVLGLLETRLGGHGHGGDIFCLVLRLDGWGRWGCKNCGGLLGGLSRLVRVHVQETISKWLKCCAKVNSKS